MKQGVPWQSTLGIELAGKTLGLLGFGKLGTKVGEIGKAIGMNLIAWSENLTDEKAKAGGAAHVSKEELFRQSDFLSIHLQLSPRTRGLVDREGPRADEADRVPDQHVARADRRTSPRCSRRSASASSRAPASTRSTSSRCRSITRCASSTMSC